MKLAFSFFKASITPSRNMGLVGQAKRDSRAETLGPSDLFVRIVWLRADVDLIFVSMDSLYFSREIADAVAEYAHHTYKVPQANILFNASHTHSAPGQDLAFFGQIDAAYLRDIEHKIRQGLDECHAGFIDGYASFSHISCGKKLFVSRRKVGRDIKRLFLAKRMILLPDDAKPVDNDIHLIKLYDGDGRLVAVIYNFSCHPVFNISGGTSSDFAGAVSNELERRVCRFAMFLQGFSGDVRPNYTQEKAPVTDIVNFLKLRFNDKVFATYQSHHFRHFCDTISRCIIEHAGSNGTVAPDVTSPLRLVTRMYTATLESRTGRTRKDAVVKLVRMADNIIISIPAEVLSGYVTMLREKIPGFRLYPLGYANGMIGYLPSADEMREGGYEIDTSFRYYGWDDRIAESSITRFADRLIAELSELVKS